MSLYNLRLIEKPGYHVSSQYDLTYLRLRKKRNSQKVTDFGLSLTAMIDMFSTLVIFLLLNFSATGEAYFVSKKVILPGAAHVRPLESAPLISITPTSVILDAQIMGSHLNLNENNSTKINLVEGLRKIKKLQNHEKNASQPSPLSQINIQADEQTPVLRIKEIMNLLAQEGFTGVNFAVREINPQNL